MPEVCVHTVHRSKGKEVDCNLTDEQQRKASNWHEANAEIDYVGSFEVPWLRVVEEEVGCPAARVGPVRSARLPPVSRSHLLVIS